MNWISVKDRLPETTAQSVGTGFEYQASKKLLILKDGESEAQKAIYQYGENFKSFAQDYGDDMLIIEPFEVTHWMPLPEAPTLNTKE
jgi:hypothetical protein